MPSLFSKAERKRAWRGLFAALLFSACLAAAPQSGSATSMAQSAGRYYAETGHSLAAQFVSFYDSHGGLPLFGYPITEARMEGGFLVQWTERERLEWHPQNAGTDYAVQLGLLGRELTRGLTGPRFSAATMSQALPDATGPQTPSEGTFFAETGQVVSEPFLSYWSAHGGVRVFGYPISSRYRAENGVDVQWFERARFEMHPELPSEFRVTLGLVGSEASKVESEPYYEFLVSETSVPSPNLRVGLSQGGESEDPGFFDNIRDAGAALGPALVRLDNIYTFYHIVRRAADGTISYDWAELDRVVDGIRAMGKEPFICLSYMPEQLSVTGASRVTPPADYTAWSALVSATVTHLNVERRLGVRYWEVWNEPNIWDFWQSSFEEYLKLYDATVQAATGADPTVRIGGPAFSYFETSGISEFLSHEASVPGGRVDFLSWHAYGATPDEVAAQVRQARALVANYPNLHPELIISEFNVQQGGPGDTSADHLTDKVGGAINFLASVESMQRERLDQALLFELKDGMGPKAYWGRWGVLTNDGSPKPIYYALQSFLRRPSGMMPVTPKRGPVDGSVGLMAFGSKQASTLFLWYTGDRPAQVKVTLPADFAGNSYSVALFDSTHNNPASTGNPALELLPSRDPGDLIFGLEPNSLVILESEGFR